MKATSKTNVKEWHLITFPYDELGEDINPEITFSDVFYTLDKGKDIYELIGVADSLVRERIFLELSNLSGHTYDEIYNKWLKA